MPSISRIRPAVISARELLAQGREKLKAQHQSGSPGIQVCARLTDLVDTVLLDLFEDALSSLSDDQRKHIQSKIALVPYGGYGRRDLAPYSDVDLMLLCSPGEEAQITPLAQRLSQNIYDTGLQLGFSVRTPSQTCEMSRQDATVFTSLVEARYLGGSVALFSKFSGRFQRFAKRYCRRLLPKIEQARREERIQYGETVYLLEPNIKRSRGGLRDIQMVRWVGFARYGEAEPENLRRAGNLSKDDQMNLREAWEFLLRLRNELHFHANKSYDVLDKSEQIRLAEWFGYQGDKNLLPVERFMRDYFQQTGNVRYSATNFVASARPRARILTFLAPLVSHQVEGDFRVGPIHITATRNGIDKLRGNLDQVLRLMDLANLYNKRIDHPTWMTIRQSMVEQSSIELTSEARERFLSLLSQPAKLGEMLRRLHQLRVLEKIIPAMEHAHCLMQFNEYHKYTVDEHSIRAVQCAADFLNDEATLGKVYRSIKQKRTLHLALLIHDLGKGFPEDHSEVGLRLAEETADHLGLPDHETEVLKLLVHKHLLMSHLAQWRDIDDDAVVMQLAVEVGSPDVLRMLYVLTCADIAAVGPGVLNQWKLSLITELYNRTMRYISADESILSDQQRLIHQRNEIREKVKGRENPEWWDKQIDCFPSSLLMEGKPQRVVELLERLRQLPHNEAIAWGRFSKDRNAVEYTVGTYEEITPGVFHQLTGALASKRLQILSADIYTLADSLILDRFFVNDLDFTGEPPQHRLDEVSKALVETLTTGANQPPKFGSTWQANQSESKVKLDSKPSRVGVDNNTSERYTIIDIFTQDRIGLLFTITRTLFELGLSVSVAKIGTWFDQVVDVFYVTDESGNKIEDENRIRHIRSQLLEAVEKEK